MRKWTNSQKLRIVAEVTAARKGGEYGAIASILEFYGVTRQQVKNWGQWAGGQVQPKDIGSGNK